MSEARDLLMASSERLLRDQVDKALVDEAEQGIWPEALWGALEENGLTLAPVPEAAGGAGLELADALALLRIAGRFALPVPLAEHMLAARALAEAGHAIPQGLLGVSVLPGVDEPLARFSGRVAIPWGRQVAALVCVTRAGAVLVDAGAAQIERGSDLAGEPRDSLLFQAAPVVALTETDRSEEVFAELALARAVAMAGALESILEMSVGYAGEREQFGRPIAKFQAIQHQLALLAAEVAAAIRAADGALAALGSEREAVEIAVAKARIGEAVGRSTDIAHQVHGAMGFTHEHPLHHRTRRLWQWRDDYGDEAFWQRRLGAAVVAAGADGAWAFMVGR